MLFNNTNQWLSCGNLNKDITNNNFKYRFNHNKGIYGNIDDKIKFQAKQIDKKSIFVYLFNKNIFESDIYYRNHSVGIGSLEIKYCGNIISYKRLFYPNGL